MWWDPVLRLTTAEAEAARQAEDWPVAWGNGWWLVPLAGLLVWWWTSRPPKAGS